MQTLLIVDDEPLARKRLLKMLAKHSAYKVLGEAAHGEEAVEKVLALSPDIVLLDIKMPGLNGIEAAVKMAEQGANPAIVFCTAFNDYAMEAFEANAIGYLLKPVNEEKLLAVLAKAQTVPLASLSKDLESLSSDSTTVDTITIKNQRGVAKLLLSEVCYCQSDQKYTCVYYWRDEQLHEVVIDDSLKDLEAQFPQQWLRVHRNALVSKQKIRGIQRQQNSYFVQLMHIEQGPLVSRRHVNDVKQFLALL